METELPVSDLEKQPLVYTRGFCYAIFPVIQNTAELINSACPNPNNNPVTKRRVLLLFLHFHRCVNPSISIGTVIIAQSQNGIVTESKIKIGVSKYPK